MFEDRNEIWRTLIFRIFRIYLESLNKPRISESFLNILHLSVCILILSAHYDSILIFTVIPNRALTQKLQVKTEPAISLSTLKVNTRNSCRDLSSICVLLILRHGICESLHVQLLESMHNPRLISVKLPWQAIWACQVQVHQEQSRFHLT